MCIDADRSDWAIVKVIAQKWAFGKKEGKEEGRKVPPITVVAASALNEL